MVIPGMKIVAVRNMLLIYSPDGTNVYSSKGGEFEGAWSVQVVESCKIMFLGGTSYLLVQTLLRQDVMYRLATMHSVTDRQHYRAKYEWLKIQVTWFCSSITDLH